jgi:hypothetical protein
MDDNPVRELLASALADEPPIGPVAQHSLRAGLRLRRRRRIRGAAVVAALAIAIPVATGSLGGRPAPATGGPALGPTVYVANGDSIDGTVTPIAISGNRVGQPIKAGDDVAAMALTPDAATLYVADAGSGMVTPIATASNTPGRPIEVGAGGGERALTQLALTQLALTQIALTQIALTGGCRRIPLTA